MSLYQIIVSIILGVVQGISEWLPISSKTQIIIVSQYILGLNFSQAYAFGLFMEIGTIFAAVIYFRKEVWILIRTLFGKGSASDWKLFKFALISTIVTGVIAVPIYKAVADISGGYNIGLPMIILGMILFMDALLIHYSRTKYADDKNRKTVDNIGLKEYILVGIAQGLAALPGVSRSGATTSTMLLLNIEAREAFRLSFIDMIFATTAAVFVTLIFSGSSVSSTIAQISLAGLAVAILVATGISLLLINFLLNIARKSKIIYLTAALGAIALAGGIIISFFPLAFSAG
ncbi:MAG: undecaprenyl-diphosphate phosphatase [Candidatus Micrarchaeota archaeon]|nr:undecaprenyl-diphosphate phosphatase [Candidatus Micrarchaeota archaeon]